MSATAGADASPGDERPLPEDACIAALRRMYGARGQAGADHILPFLTDDFAFVPAGTDRSSLQEDYTGPAGFARFIRRQADWTDDTWWPVLDEMLVGERWVVAVVRVETTRTDGTAGRFRILHRWQRRGGLFAAFRSFVDDQAAYDRFHTATDADSATDSAGQP
ncbi:nuclear transport factor 2 family protein [Nakamurella endophytica]|uniref:SnoaL-like domain-containing protein n=1 Tax=Nakamurella endophytica TaxID=1748367 RepID=A0A917SQU9_9ACTN|nr:nuclear transport factor 2 family protein [Nakamurella endophytica]GGL91754.1 hypothetical protein GCM10011594_09420 [Nakamurella endophytica]